MAPARAFAHAAFVSAEPRPGAKLSGAPGVVVLTFTEPLNRSLSRAAVRDPTGLRFEGRATSAREVQVGLSTNAPGLYDVEWTTVSTLDGHTLRGSFRFGVGAAPPEGSSGRTGSAPRLPDLIVGVARAFEYAGLLWAVGLLLIARLIARLAPAVSSRPARPSTALSLAFASGLAVVVGEALLAAPAPSAGALAAYLTTGVPGAARLGRLVAEAAALRMSVIGARAATAVLTLAALAALAAAGHAAAVRPGWWGIGVDTVHLVAAGLWAGGILALATSRPAGGWRGPEARRLLERFSPVAVPAFLVTVAFGTLRAFQELEGPGDLVSSSYGRILSIKVLAVAAMVPLSVAAWRRRGASPRLEAPIAVLVIGAAALLAAYPLPPGRAGESEEARERAPAASAVPRPGDLTMGAGAGEVLVGLTLRPALPGRNEVLVHVVAPGETRPVSLAVELAVDGAEAGLRRCGPSCRRGSAGLDGGEIVDVRVRGRKGGSARFTVPVLPVADGAGLLSRVQERVHRLVTLRLDETLRPPEPPILTSYTMQAPDRFRLESSTGFQTVSIGGTQYRREGAAGGWSRTETGFPIEVPFFIWDSEEFVAARIVDAQSEDMGVEAEVVSFFEGTEKNPIWFRLWVDREHLVRKAEMRALGHYMDHRYYDFDAEIAIEPPV